MTTVVAAKCNLIALPSIYNDSVATLRRRAPLNKRRD